MRLIFEEVDHEYFFEIILSAEDLEDIQTLDGIIREYIWDTNNIRDINVYIRKDKKGDLCHSLKERRQVQKKDSQKTCAEKCMKASPKSKQWPLLIAKRVEAKKVKLKRKNEK